MTVGGFEDERQMYYDEFLLEVEGGEMVAVSIPLTGQRFGRV